MRPSAFVTLNYATPEMVNQFDLAVTLWAGAEAMMDAEWRKEHPIPPP